MIFYHGTSKENWEQIKQEGVLWGKRCVVDKNGKVLKEFNPDRCTYLTPDKEEAEQYGDVVLQVEYDPYTSTHNNYNERSWQMRVYEPIALSNIKLVENESN